MSDKKILAKSKKHRESTALRVIYNTRKRKIIIPSSSSPPTDKKLKLGISSNISVETSSPNSDTDSICSAVSSIFDIDDIETFTIGLSSSESNKYALDPRDIMKKLRYENCKLENNKGMYLENVFIKETLLVSRPHDIMADSKLISVYSENERVNQETNNILHSLQTKDALSYIRDKDPLRNICYHHLILMYRLKYKKIHISNKVKDIITYVCNHYNVKILDICFLSFQKIFENYTLFKKCIDKVYCMDIPFDVNRVINMVLKADLIKFHMEINDTVETLKIFKPFKTRKEQLLFHHFIMEYIKSPRVLKNYTDFCVHYFNWFLK